MIDKEAAAYKRGYKDGFAENRIAAFGAIRRAAEIAREYDALRMNAQDARDWPGEVQAQESALSVRIAIRAAIGSEKA